KAKKRNFARPPKALIITTRALSVFTAASLEAASKDSNGKLKSRHGICPSNQAGEFCAACTLRYGTSSATAVLGSNNNRSLSVNNNPVNWQIGRAACRERVQIP